MMFLGRFTPEFFMRSEEGRAFLKRAFEETAKQIGQRNDFRRQNQQAETLSLFAQIDTVGTNDKE